MATYPYSPLSQKTGKRLHLRITDAHLIKMAKAGLTSDCKGVVQDAVSQKWYRVWGAPCKQEKCFCDAVAIEIEPDASGVVDGKE